MQEAEDGRGVRPGHEEKAAKVLNRRELIVRVNASKECGADQLGGIDTKYASCSAAMEKEFALPVYRRNSFGAVLDERPEASEKASTVVVCTRRRSSWRLRVVQGIHGITV